MKRHLSLLALTLLLSACGVEQTDVWKDIVLSGDEDTTISGDLAGGLEHPVASEYVMAVETQPVHGALFVTGTTVTYVPEADFSGADEATVRASNSNAVERIKVSVTVNPVNDAPLAVSSDYVLDEDEVLEDKLVFIDVDGDMPTVTLGDVGPANGSVVIDPTTGSFIYTPDAEYSGEDRFSFVVDDGIADASSAEVFLKIRTIDDAPQPRPQKFVTLEDQLLTGQVVADDVDSPNLVYRLKHNATKGTVVMDEDGSFTYTPDADANGEDVFTYEVSDGGDAGWVAGNVTVDVTPVNDVPVTVGGAAVTDEDTAVSGILSAADVDGDTLTFEIVDQPANGTVQLLSGGGFNYVPNENWSGVDEFTFRVSDGEAFSGKAVVEVTVIQVNDAPSVGNILLMDVVEDQSKSAAVWGSDVDGDALTFEVVAQPGHGAVVMNANGSFQYTPDADYFGPDSFSYRAFDGSLHSNTAAVSFAVEARDDVPVAYAAHVTTDEDTTLNGMLSAHDADGQVLTFYKTGTTLNGGAIVEADGRFTFIPTADFFGEGRFHFYVSDGVNLSSTATVTVTVNSVNDAPVAVGKTRAVSEDNSTSDTFGVTDKDSSIFTYRIVQEPAHGVVRLTEDGYTYWPEFNYNGADSFTFVANDGQADSNEATITLNVNANNDRAHVVNQYLEVPVNSDTVNGKLTATDAEGDVVTYELSSSPKYGNATVGADGTFAYKPHVDSEGYDAFTVKAVDAGGAYGHLARVVIKVGSCVDLDGDGFGESCMLGSDCDDSDPAVYPGAPELPGDGIAQSCGGADMTPSDLNGIFLSKTGNDADAGTMAAPVATLGKAIELAGTTKSVFVGAGDYTVGIQGLGVSLYCGYDSSDWTRNIDLFKTTITATYLYSSKHIAVQGCTLQGQGALTLNADATVADNVLKSLSTGWGSPAVNVQGGRTVLLRNSITNGAVTDGHSTGVSVHPNAAVVARDNDITTSSATQRSTGIAGEGVIIAEGNRIRVGEGDVGANGIYARGFAVIRNNVLSGSTTRSIDHIEVSGARFAWVLNNTILSPADGTARGGGVRVSYSAAVIANNLIEGTLVGVSADRADMWLRNNVLPAACVTRPEAMNCLSDVERLNACTWHGCMESGGNLDVDALLADDGSLEAGSSAIDAGVDPVTLFGKMDVQDDFEGSARPLGLGWDIGAFERE